MTSLIILYICWAVTVQSARSKWSGISDRNEQICLIKSPNTLLGKSERHVLHYTDEQTGPFIWGLNASKSLLCPFDSCPWDTCSFFSLSSHFLRISSLFWFLGSLHKPLSSLTFFPWLGSPRWLSWVDTFSLNLFVNFLRWRGGE